ncbi:Metallo-dependent phosphatase-like protein [Macrophomina phaseolina]|uniref:Metallo-dependent phosphatase-like protein n=1 Tax=Macrophomina phaseolina TaxID=35725 RepID=A0ABQ8GWF2_9PEZI|nr:Metallo-dependent phosphatase-like protein [Macrophomina phaseolina]
MLEEPAAKRPSVQQQQQQQQQQHPESKKRIRFLIISDTHENEEDDKTERTSAFQPPTHLTDIDVVLHCGDLTENGTLAELTKAIDKLAAIRAQLRLFIAGNHEIALDERYYRSQGGDAETHAAALKAVREDALAKGVTYLEEGTHAFALEDGAAFTLYASPWTPACGQSAFQYESREDRFNPPGTTPEWATNTATKCSIIPEGVDVVMTHGPPMYVLDDTGRGNSGGCEHLRRAVCRVKPRLHCFGHVHRGYGAQRVFFERPQEEEDDDDEMRCEPQLKEFVGRNQARRKGYASLSPGSDAAWKEDRQTLMVNAAVMDDQEKATNVPWVVEMEL